MRWTNIGKGPMKWVVLVSLSLALLACDGGERARQRQEAMDTLTTRQKDSLLATMPIPGARALGKALTVADSANARTERIDSIIGNKP
jgi:hypothetical protein